jgi:RNA polymerase sigma-70 factor, ECF subfamily
MSLPARSVTLMLLDWSGGDKAALERLIPAVEKELRRLAARYLRRERANHSLQAADLVQEAYLRLMDVETIQWQNRAHFFGIAATLMRRILMDYARKHNAGKRRHSVVNGFTENIGAASPDRFIDLVALDEALARLALLDAQQSRIVELRYFCGLSVEETAEVLGSSERTVKRDWQMAKAWLRAEIWPDHLPQ